VAQQWIRETLKQRLPLPILPSKWRRADERMSGTRSSP
jgi:hypothetical protein